MAGIYVHIPFCKSRCIYCGFYSTVQLNLCKPYINAVCKEMRMRKEYIKGEKFSTVYIGGGTPSTLNGEELETLFCNMFEVFDISDNAEITMECNPNDIDVHFIKTLKRLPVNRISIGAQTFSDKRLRFIHRRHCAEEVYNAVKLLRSAGYNNLSIDMMFGFPGETLDEWLTDIDKALSLNVEHISAYSLMYEEGTCLYNMLENGEVKEIDEELSLSMYNALVSKLTTNGYEHYEISNFARPGYRSRHNSSYWQQVRYIGLGAAAHSFDLKSRQWNISEINKYISEINKGNVPMEREELDSNTIFNDIITTSLRTCEGIDLNYISNKLGEDYKNNILENADRYIKEGLVKISNDHLKLTKGGIYVSDAIMSSLMIV